QRAEQRGSSSLAKSQVSASPPLKTFSLGSPGQPASIKLRHVDGVACIAVTPARDMVCAKAFPSRVVSASTIISRAPAESGRYKWETDASNDMEHRPMYVY